ncbi:MAG TPA: hypothetical protein PLT03_02010, partial [Bacillota bacterium]|nr:hypothetical protein [Bacillota bacterium]
MKHPITFTKLTVIALLIISMGFILGGSLAAEEAALTPVQEYAVKLAAEKKDLTYDVAASLGTFNEVGLAEYKSYVKVTDILMENGF